MSTNYGVAGKAGLTRQPEIEQEKRKRGGGMKRTGSEGEETETEITREKQMKRIEVAADCEEEQTTTIIICVLNKGVATVVEQGQGRALLRKE